MTPKGTEKALSAGGNKPNRLEISISPKAEKDLRRLSSSTLARLQKALEELAQGSPHLDIKPLRGLDPWWRLRVGSYRVLYRIRTKQKPGDTGTPDAKVILVARCVPRKELETESRKLR